MLDLLWAVAAIFLVLWIVGFAMNFTVGGLLHLLLVLAVITIFVRLIGYRTHSHA
jgi:hypothetical protein